jgi:hypothetical protein
MSSSALRVQRDRQEAAGGALDRKGGRAPDCAAAMLVVTTTVSSYPAAAGSFFACNPAQLNGAEVEGGAATPVVDRTTIIYASNQGTSAPPPGTPVVVHGCGGKWVFRYDG